MTCEWALSTSPGRSPVFTMEDPVSGVENPVNMDNPVNPVENPVNPVNPVKNPVTTQENSTESVASPVLPVVNPINRVEQGWIQCLCEKPLYKHLKFLKKGEFIEVAPGQKLH